MFTIQCMQMFYSVYISSGIQNTVCKQKVPVAKKYLMKVMFTLYQSQYGNLSVFIKYFVEYFIKKGHFFEGALFKMGGEFCLQ